MKYQTMLAQLEATAKDLLAKGGFERKHRACCTASCACCLAWTGASIRLAAELTSTNAKVLEALRAVLAVENCGTQLQRLSAVRTARELLENIDKETD